MVRSAKHPHAAGLAGEAEWFMDYWNADGSIAEMCGNGVRVFARYLATEALVDGAEFPIATRSGVVQATVTADEVSVVLPLPRVGAGSTATIGGLTFTGTSVDVGNPHLVCALPKGMSLGDLDLTAAPSYDPAAFPTGVNVEFTVPGTSEEATFGHIAVDRRPSRGHIAVDAPPTDQREQGHIAVDSPPADGRERRATSPSIRPRRPSRSRATSRSTRPLRPSPTAATSPWTRLLRCARSVATSRWTPRRPTGESRAISPSTRHRPRSRTAATSRWTAEAASSATSRSTSARPR